jgi:hypothetical protein
LFCVCIPSILASMCVWVRRVLAVRECMHVHGGVQSAQYKRYKRFMKKQS